MQKIYGYRKTSRDSLAERKERKKRKHAGKVEDILRDEWREARHHWGKKLSMRFGWQKKCALLHGDTLSHALGMGKVMVMGMDMSMGMDMGMVTVTVMAIDTGMESH